MPRTVRGNREIVHAPCPEIRRLAAYTISVYRCIVIQSFADAATADLWEERRLEALAGDRKGQHSIRVNQQYRITFRWEGHDAHDVCCEDYH